MQSASLKWILRPLAGLYGLITTIRNLCYDCGIFKSEMLPVPVISVGNITAGGTGKTPFVIALAEYLTQNGYRAAIITRGYRRHSKGQVIVADGPHILATPQQAGDEAYLMARQLPGTVIISDADRTAAVRTALKKFDCNVILADDAFQHRRLGRCLDIVLWDAHTAPQNEQLLPAGRLRESLRGLRRADLLVFAKSDVVDSRQKDSLLKYNPNLLFFAAPLIITGLGDFSGKDGAAIDIKGKTILAFCGLGNPAQFEATVQKLNPAQIIIRRFPDHHKYSAADVRQLISIAERLHCDYLVTTAKDAVNLPPDQTESAQILILKIALQLDEKIKAAVLHNMPPL